MSETVRSEVPEGESWFNSGFMSGARDAFSFVSDHYMKYEKHQAEKDAIGAAQYEVNNAPEAKTQINDAPKPTPAGGISTQTLALAGVGLAVALIVVLK